MVALISIQMQCIDDRIVAINSSSIRWLSGWWDSHGGNLFPIRIHFMTDAIGLSNGNTNNHIQVMVTNSASFLSSQVVLHLSPYIFLRWWKSMETTDSKKTMVTMTALLTQETRHVGEDDSIARQRKDTEDKIRPGWEHGRLVVSFRYFIMTLILMKTIVY